MPSRCWSSAFHRAAVFAAIVIVIGSITAARAASPAAIIEEVDSAKATVQFMDYVASGTVIRLGPSDSLVLGYIRSCWRETIRGGVVTVGAEQSKVAGGKVAREKVECDGGRMRLSPAQARSAGAAVFRGKPKAATAVTLYSLSPIFIMDGSGLLIIKRSDDVDDPIELNVAKAPSARVAVYDMAKEGGKLKAGGAYRAISRSDAVDFYIDPNAVAGGASIVGRVIRFRGDESPSKSRR